MENNINIAALLKDCPKGTKLYSTAYGEVSLTKKSIYDIVVEDPHGNEWGFTKYGSIYEESECLLFPSKEVRDWGMFHVKYVVLTDDKERNKKLLSLFGKVNNEREKGLLSIKGIDNKKIIYLDRLTNCLYSDDDSCSDKTDTKWYDPSFEYIIDTGAELKLEEEEQSKFKVGDVVKNKFNELLIIANPPFYENSEQYSITLKNVLTEVPATPEEIDKWNKEVLEPNHLHYSKSKRKIIHWFLPFDKVVSRPGNEGDFSFKWSISFFSHYNKELSWPYVCLNDRECSECLPYNEKTAKLIGTTNDWEE